MRASRTVEYGAGLRQFLGVSKSACQYKGHSALNVEERIKRLTESDCSIYVNVHMFQLDIHMSSPVFVQYVKSIESLNRAAQ